MLGRIGRKLPLDFGMTGGIVVGVRAFYRFLISLFKAGQVSGRNRLLHSAEMTLAEGVQIVGHLGAGDSPDPQEVPNAIQLVLRKPPVSLFRRVVQNPESLADFRHSP